MGGTKGVILTILPIGKFYEIEVYSTFRLKYFLNDGGSFTQNRRKIRHLFCVVFAVYLGHGISYPVAVLVFSKSVFGRCLQAPKLRNLSEKKVGYLSIITRVENFIPGIF